MPMCQEHIGMFPKFPPTILLEKRRLQMTCKIASKGQDERKENLCQH